MGVSDLVVDECRLEMLIPSMNISSLMVHAEQIEEQKLKRMNKEVKRARTGDGNSSNARSEEQGQQRFKRRSSNQDSPMVNKDGVYNPNSQGGNGGGSSFERSTCAKCGKQHLGKCLAGTDGCFGCGKKGHKMRECPTLSAKGREAKQASYDGTVPIPPNYGRFYALRSREDKGALPDESTGMLIIPYRCKCFIKVPMLFGRFSCSP
ncbi:uncharacterized protein LOC125829124 [Solanum verrucosum]|uniref:uncharacterized protein LOC125829124 n=1 Tax=Solanum verrucosum TaxID=315347 RepID=UPI0020D14979|nr:uncharacterized protein LOC125829124 [Solanum verrucosum]